MHTPSGMYRIFNIKEEPRDNAPGAFELPPEELRGDWTFEPAEGHRLSSAMEEMRKRNLGAAYKPFLYAATYETAEEACFQAELWEKYGGGSMDKAGRAPSAQSDFWFTF